MHIVQVCPIIKQMQPSEIQYLLQEHFKISIIGHHLSISASEIQIYGENIDTLFNIYIVNLHQKYVST